MKTTTLRFKIWGPAAFCALLSIMKVNRDDGVTFYWWLPMCFVFAANVHFELLKRIETLETALGVSAEQPPKATDA